MSVDFGDGREERMDAALLALRLRRDPRVTARREAYNAAVTVAYDEARGMGKAACIDALIAHMPAYIRHRLEADDDAEVFERYARTFWKRAPEQTKAEP